MRSGEKLLNERIRSGLQKFIRSRAPWFSANINEILWCKQVAFEHRLVKQFGKDRCWMVGDAAHQTGPVGVQSLNVGLREADALATTLQQILQEGAPLNLLASYNRERREEWQSLLGLTGDLDARTDAGAWVRRRSARILPCLPASGDDLTLMANQLALDFTTVAA